MPAAIRMETTAMRSLTGVVKTLSLGSRGGRSMMSGSGGSTPRAMAGRPSVTRFTHKIWMAVSGSGRPIRLATNMIKISPTLQERR